MSLKSLAKTRWNIESDRAMIYPYGMFYLFAPIMAVFCAGLLLLYTHYQNVSVSESLPLVLLMLLAVVLMWGAAGTYIEFDNRQGRMRKMLFGFVPTVITPFAELQGINVVSQLNRGGYSYSVFRKDARHGRGVAVSSGYSRNDDPNATAFVNEVIPVVHGYLNMYDRPEDLVEPRLTSYKYFVKKGNAYAVTNRKIGAIIMGLIFFSIGGWVFTAPVDSFSTRLICIGLFFFFGFVFINAAFTQLIFDPQAQTVKRTSLIRFLDKQYSFINFKGVQTVRHTMNLIYVRTSVNLYFEVPGKNGQQEPLTVASLFRGKSVDRFIQELYQIMNSLKAE